MPKNTTPQQVVIFTNPSERVVQDEFNAWSRSMGESIRIVDQQFSTTASQVNRQYHDGSLLTVYSLAIFYQQSQDADTETEWQLV